MSGSINTEAREQNDAPSLLGAHVQYVKGAVEETIGSVTGSSAWTESGTSDKEAGVSGMKAASANRDAQVDGYGKIEEIAGRVTGCEGMEQEGKESAGSAGTGTAGTAAGSDGQRLV